MSGNTFVQKVLARKAGINPADIQSGQIVTVKPDHLLTHDNTSAIIAKVKDELKENGVVNKDLHIIVLDHVIPAVSEKTATGHTSIRKYVKEHGIKNFFDVGEGVCHQVVIEKGLALPGAVIVGSDSHTCSYGAVGCFSTGVDRTESASLILTGELWLRVPETIKVVLHGKFAPGVTAKDLILRVIGDCSASGAAYSTLEWHGDALKNLSISERVTIANMGVEMDSKGSIFPLDDVTRQYFIDRGIVQSGEELDNLARMHGYEWADEDASYIQVLDYDLTTLVPVVSKPHTVDNVAPVCEVAGTVINQCFLGTCTNGRYEDLRMAANVLRGKKVSPSVRLLVCPASREEYIRSLNDDTISILVQAGGILLPTGCGPCLGAHQGVLAPGEICLSTANRNFKGRMGCRDAFIYLASPLTVAASAIEGKIVDPRHYV